MTSDIGFESTAEEVTEGLDLSGKTFLITGCNSGLGLETARVLALRGAHIVGTARTQEKAEAALASVAPSADALACELSDPASVLACAKSIRALGRPLHALLCNAAVMALPEPRTTLGFDLQFLTNHLGHFLLVTESLDALTDRGRVILVSSGSHKKAPKAGIEFDNLDGIRDYAPWKMYGQSKLANILFANALAKRFGPKGRTANSLHPGVINTNLARHIPDAEAMYARRKTKTVEQGAATQCFVAARPEVRSVSGRYFMDCKPTTPAKLATDEELAERLWARSEEAVRVFKANLA